LSRFQPTLAIRQRIYSLAGFRVYFHYRQWLKPLSHSSSQLKLTEIWKLSRFQPTLAIRQRIYSLAVYWLSNSGAKSELKLKKKQFSFKIPLLIPFKVTLKKGDLAGYPTHQIIGIKSP
ncbi:hypothetical protein, partial [Limnofasciculus baicalensis]